MTTSLYLGDLYRNIYRTVWDEKFNSKNQESIDKLYNIYNIFKQRAEGLPQDEYGNKIRAEGKAFFDRVINHLDQIPKKTPPINCNQKA